MVPGVPEKPIYLPGEAFIAGQARVGGDAGSCILLHPWEVCQAEAMLSTCDHGRQLQTPLMPAPRIQLLGWEGTRLSEVSWPEPRGVEVDMLSPQRRTACHPRVQPHAERLWEKSLCQLQWGWEGPKGGGVPDRPGAPGGCPPRPQGPAAHFCCWLCTPPPQFPVATTALCLRGRLVPRVQVLSAGGVGRKLQCQPPFWCG